MAAFEKRLLLASRGKRDDWVARFLLPIIDEAATERLLDSGVRPRWLVQAAIALTILAAILVTRGHDRIAAATIALALPLDLIGARLAVLRLKPFAPSLLWLRLLWPSCALFLLAIGWSAYRHLDQPAALVAALAAIAFGEALRIERRQGVVPGAHWLFARRPAMLAAIPLLAFSAGQAFLLAMAAYAAASFFVAQQAVHHGTVD